MKASHLVLAVMAALVVLVGGAAAFGPSIMGMFGGQSNAPQTVTIAVVTEELLNSVRSEAMRAERQQQQQQQQQVAQPAAPATAAPAATQRPGAPVTQGAPATPTPAMTTANLANTMAQSAQDGLATELIGRLQRTQRFNVKHPSQFLTALQDIANRPQQAREPSPWDRMRFWEKSEQTQSTNAQGQNQTTNARSGGVSFGNASAQDLRGAGQRLGANYVLIVAYKEGVARLVTEETEAGFFTYDWEPVLIYSVFNVDTGNVVASDQTVLSAIRVKVPINYLGSDAFVDRRTRDLMVGLHDRVASMMTRIMVNLLAPPRIVRTDGATLFVDRGSNDGVEEGQVYDVQRGAAIDTHRPAIGQVRITNVRATESSAERVEGDIARNDLVLIGAGAAAVSQPGRAPGNLQVALGEQQEGPNAPKPVLAIENLRVDPLEPSLDWHVPPDSTMVVTRAIADALQRGQQVDVLNRNDLDRVMRERQRAARANGADDSDLEFGMDTAPHVLTGEVQLSAARTGSSVSVGGQTRTTSTGWRLTATGTIRVQNLNGREAYNVQVRTQRPGSPTDRVAVSAVLDAFATDAAAALIVRLYPIRIESIAADGVTAYLNKGPEAGLRVGTRLRAFLIDTRTRTRQSLGELVVTDAATNYNATARITGARFTVPNGARVELEVQNGGAPAPARASQPQAAPTENTSSSVRF